MQMVKNAALKLFKMHTDGVRRINIYLLRLVYALTFLFVGSEAWIHLLTFDGKWDHVKAVAFCVWAAYATLSFLGLLHPVKMLPLVLFQILYKILWLGFIAYPLWSAGQLTGSPAEAMAYTYVWVWLPIVAVPWPYVFKTFVIVTRKNATA